MIRFVKSVALLPLLFLTSCAGLVWENLSFEGPLIEGNRHARGFLSCGPGSVEFHQCIVAVEDHHGRKVDTEDIENAVNSYLPNVPTLSKYVEFDPTYKEFRPAQKSSIYRAAYTSYEIPYTLHLLTISPVVILSVPAESSDTAEEHGVRGGGGRQGAMRNLAFDGYLVYKLPPKVRPGTFWFSPDLKVSETPINVDQGRYSIDLGSSTLNLIAEGGVWKVTRDLAHPH